MCFQEVGNASQLVISVPLHSAWGEYLFYLLGVCSYLTPVDYVLHRCSSRGLGNIHVDSVLKENIQWGFFSSSRCTSKHMLRQCHVSIKPTEIGGMIGDSLRSTSHVAVCQIRSSTERAIPNQNIFQDDWEYKRIYRWEGINGKPPVCVVFFRILYQILC